MIGAGERGRTGDVQLGNFVLNLMFSFFQSKNLSDLLRRRKLLSTINDFNYFHTFYFCRGHVLGHAECP